jgi:hypothetical protein
MLGPGTLRTQLMMLPVLGLMLCSMMLAMPILRPGTTPLMRLGRPSLLIPLLNLRTAIGRVHQGLLKVSIICFDLVGIKLSLIK